MYKLILFTIVSTSHIVVFCTLTAFINVIDFLFVCSRCLRKHILLKVLCKFVILKQFFNYIQIEPFSIYAFAYIYIENVLFIILMRLYTYFVFNACLDQFQLTT